MVTFPPSLVNTKGFFSKPHGKNLLGHLEVKTHLNVEVFPVRLSSPKFYIYIYVYTYNDFYFFPL